MSRSEDNEAVDERPAKKRPNRFIPLDEAPQPGLSPRAREVVGLALCGASLYGILSLATFRFADLDGPIPTGGAQNLGGAVGYHLAHGLVRSLGYAGWIPFAMLLAAGVWLLLGRRLERLSIKALGAVVLAAMLAILFASARPGDPIAATAGAPFGPGGIFGHVVSQRLEAAFGTSGRLLVVVFGALMALLIVTGWLFSQIVRNIAVRVEMLWKRCRRQTIAVATANAAPAGSGALEGTPAAGAESARRRRRSPAAPPIESDEGVIPAAAGEIQAKVVRAADGADAAAPPLTPRVGPASSPAPAPPDPVVELPRPETPPDRLAPAPAAAESAPPPIAIWKPKPRPKPKPKPRKAGQAALPFEDYPFPPIDLFQEPVLNDATATSDVLARGGQAIVNKLANFGIVAEVVAASVGPAVTQYELRLAESIRVNKVVGFESDLAAALKAVSVRVVAPIPGKDTIGVEVPNAERQKVFMRDLLDQFGRSEDLAIPLYLGKDVAGNPIVEDLARMPHLLIAGTTGSGKSVCINTILLSILMTRTPSQVKLILVDPKMVELQAYKRVPHLCCDVVTNMKKAPGVLQWAVDEMENRYALLSAAGVNHIRNYNRLGQQELSKRLQREPDPERVHLPYVVIVIDEFADLMNVAQNEVEELIQRLAQKSRAVGMHVILATQRPSSEVITGIIKANLPCQIAFKVNRRIDSRVILDANGAEKLLGYGDMLYMPPGGGALLRAQGTFVADDELHAVVRFLEEHGQEPQFMPSLVQVQSSSRPAVADRDERYREAVEIVLGQQRGSATLLQRALAVGYTRATRLLELMEEDGLVGPFVGSKSRDVLMTLEEWRAREEQREAAAADGESGDRDDADAGEGGRPDDGAGSGTAATAADSDADDERHGGAD